MKLRKTSEGVINRMDVKHLAINVDPGAPGPPSAWLSVFGPMVTLETDFPIAIPEGPKPIFWLPTALRPATAYLPPGYMGDTSGIYISKGYFMHGTVSSRWVRRQWTWQRHLGRAFDVSDLLGSPPPLLLRVFSAVRRMVGWKK